MSDLPLEARNDAAARALDAAPARKVLAVAVFVLLTAVGARISVPMVPVPISMQTLAVSLAGLLLGARLGALSQLAYLALGAAGLPVFVGGAGLAYLLGPTGGYLLAFPAAAAVTGWLAGRVRAEGARGTVLLAVAVFLGTVPVFAGGWAQLTILTGDAGRAFAAGVAPFVAGDIIKVLLAVAVAGRLRGRTRELR